MNSFIKELNKEARKCCFSWRHFFSLYQKLLHVELNFHNLTLLFFFTGNAIFHFSLSLRDVYSLWFMTAFLCNPLPQLTSLKSWFQPQLLTKAKSKKWPSKQCRLPLHIKIYFILSNLPNDTSSKKERKSLASLQCL